MFIGQTVDVVKPPTDTDVDATDRKLFLQMSSLERSRMRQIVGLDAKSNEVLDYADPTKYPIKFYQSPVTYNKSLQQYALDDWNRILADAKTCVQNPANDRFTNYVLYNKWKGGTIKVQELNDLPTNYEIEPGKFVNMREYRYRKPHIDDKEPRPRITSNNDYGALSVHHAGFVYALLNGDTDKVGGFTGYQYANAVRQELLHYANRKPDFDFSNTTRFPRFSSQVFDRNPIFFWACWLNSMLNAYDYTKASTAYTATEHRLISNWFVHAVDYMYFNWYRPVEAGRFKKWTQSDYSNPVASNYSDNRAGTIAWNNAKWIKYGFSEAWSNRSCAIWRYIARASIFLTKWDKHNINFGSIKNIRDYRVPQFVKEWLAFFISKDGYIMDLVRTGYAQVGMSYAWDNIGLITDICDTWERNMYDESVFESLYEWKLTSNLKSKYYPTVKTWTQQCIPNADHERSVFEVLSILSEMHNRNDKTRYSNARGAYIDGFDGQSASSYDNTIQMDGFASCPMVYYGAKHPTDSRSTIIKALYTRQGTGNFRVEALRDYSGVSRVGSYDVQNGVWGGHAGIWLQFGYLENSQFNPFIDSNYN